MVYSVNLLVDRRSALAQGVPWGQSSVDLWLLVNSVSVTTGY